MTVLRVKADSAEVWEDDAVSDEDVNCDDDEDVERVGTAAMVAIRSAEVDAEMLSRETNEEDENKEAVPEIVRLDHVDSIVWLTRCC